MAITAETRTEIIELIVGMVGAAPGATYLSEFADLVDSGVSLRDLAIAIADNPAYKALYPSFLTAEEFATSFITQLLGDEVSAATLQTAIDAMIADLNSGSHRGAAIYTAITALSGMSDTDANFGDAVAAFNNKTEVANHYSVVTQQSSDVLDVLVGVVSDVDSSSASVVTAKAAVDALAAQGEDYTLTTRVDSLRGTADNDTFLAVVSDSTDRTLTIADNIDGRAGTDTLLIESDIATVDISSATVRNVENLVVGSTGGITVLNAGNHGFTSVSLDVSGAVGVPGEDDEGNATVTPLANALTISGISTAATVSIGAFASAGVRTITYSDASGVGDSATINIGSARAFGATGVAASATGVTPIVDAVTETRSALNVLGMETLNLNFTGSVSLHGLNVFTDTQTLNISSSASATAATTVNLSGAMGDGSTVNISGAGVVDLGTLHTTIAAVDASASTGGVKATLGLETASVAGGSGKDAITLEKATEVTVGGVTVNTFAGDDSIDISVLLGEVNSAADAAKYTFIAGTGDDTLIVNGDAAANEVDRGIINSATGVENLRFKTAVTAFNGTLFTGLSNFIFAAAAGQDVTYNVKNNDSLTFMGSNTDMVTLDTPDTPTDVLNLSLLTATGDKGLAGIVYAGFSIKAFEVLNLGSWDTTGQARNMPNNTITELAVSNNTRINITGNAELILTAVDGQQLTIDGSAATAKLTITGGAGNDLISGGSADDALNGGAGNDVVNGGAGKDTITASAGTDTLTGGAGIDTFVITSVGSLALHTAVDSIADYSADILEFAALNNVAGGTSGAAVAETTVFITAGGKVSFAAADDTLEEKLIAVKADDGNVGAGEVVFFEDSGNTYVYGADASGSGDFMVQLTGVTGLTTLAEGTGDNVGNFTVV